MGYISSKAVFSADSVFVCVSITEDEWSHRFCVGDGSTSAVMHHKIRGRKLVFKVHLTQAVGSAHRRQLHEFATSKEADAFFCTMIPLAYKAFLQLTGLKSISS
jgi:hypothetical protein